MFHRFFSSLARFRYLSIFSISFSFTMWLAGTAKSAIRQIFFFFFSWLSLGLVAWPRLKDSFQNPREFCASNFLGRILGCAYTICSYGQIKISCTIPSGSLSPPSCVSSYPHFVLIYYIRLCDWSFHLCHHIIYICYFVLSCLFLLSLS